MTLPDEDTILAGLPGFARDSKLHLFSADMIFPVQCWPRTDLQTQG